jgi:glycosyltransferase involved in cell wall biosynthesis
VRVLHVINSIGVREGAELSLIDVLVGTQGDRGLHHDVAVLRSDDIAPPELLEAGIRILRPGQPLSSRAAGVRHVLTAIDLTSPDLVHTSLFDADLAGRVAAFIRGTPTLCSLVNEPYPPAAFDVEPVRKWKLRLVQGIDRALARWATSAVHAITEGVATAAEPRLGIAPGRIRTVPRGRSRARLGHGSAERARQVRHRLGWGEEPIILNVARQEPQKGQIHLLEAMPAVLEVLPNARLVLVGREGRSTAELWRRRDELQLGPHVDHLGVREDVPDLLAAADVFAFPSLYEGLGGAVIEAMALGTPIVASDIVALREVLDGGRCGLLVPPAASGSLAEAIVRLCSDRVLGASLRDAATARFDQCYELESCLKGMRAMYADIESAITAHHQQKNSPRRLRVTL